MSTFVTVDQTTKVFLIHSPYGRELERLRKFLFQWTAYKFLKTYWHLIHTNCNVPQLTLRLCRSFTSNQKHLTRRFINYDYCIYEPARIDRSSCGWKAKPRKKVKTCEHYCNNRENSSNKKVILRERKRHTARRVVSTPSVVLPGYPPRGGYPVWYPPGGGTRSGTPPGGYPVWYSGGVTGQVPPPEGYPDPPRCPMAFWEMLQSIMGYGYPPLWTDRWMDGRTDACQNITFPRTPYAGGKYYF